jgi:hypothetical protein
MISNLGIRWGIAAATSLALAVPFSALAGPTTVTAHLLTMSVKSLSQTTNKKDDDVFDRSSANVKDVFTVCVGNSPAKDEAIYLFLDCADLNHNVIAAIDTNPLFGTAVALGQVNFDTVDMVVSEKNGVLKSATTLVQIGLSCNAGALDVGLLGIVTLSYSALGANPACPSSGSVKIFGTGTSNLTGIIPPNFIVDDGSSISIKKRSGAISTFPPLP